MTGATNVSCSFRRVGLLALSALITSALPAQPELPDSPDAFSLPEVIDRALMANPDFLVERENIQISQDQIDREEGAFGWKLEAAIDQHRSREPLNTREYIAIGGIQLPGANARIYHEERQTLQGALKRRFWPGTEVALRGNLSRLVNSSNETSESSLFSPELEGFVGFSVMQPLLQGRGKENAFLRIELAEVKAEAAELLAQVKAMNLVAEAASRYVDVIAAEESLVHRLENVERAHGLVDRNRRRQDVGVGVEIDVTTAELAVSQRVSEQIGTEAEKFERLNNLLALLNLDPLPGRDPDFEPVDDLFNDNESYELTELTARARERRLDVDYYRRAVDSAELNYRRVVDATRPRLDLNASYGVSGLAGEMDNLGRALAHDQGEEWSIGLVLKMDLERQTVNAERRVAARQLFQARMELAKAERAVALEIDTALRRVRSARQQLETAEQAEQLASKRLDQELQALEQGKGDLYRVVEQQQVYGDALAETVATRAFLRKATIALWMATGEIFDRLHVEPAQIETLLATPPSGIASNTNSTTSSHGA